MSESSAENKTDDIIPLDWDVILEERARLFQAPPSDATPEEEENHFARTTALADRPGRMLPFERGRGSNGRFYEKNRWVYDDELIGQGVDLALLDNQSTQREHSAPFQESPYDDELDFDSEIEDDLPADDDQFDQDDQDDASIGSTDHPARDPWIDRNSGSTDRRNHRDPERRAPKLTDPDLKASVRSTQTEAFVARDPLTRERAKLTQEPLTREQVEPDETPLTREQEKPPQKVLTREQVNLLEKLQDSGFDVETAQSRKEHEDLLKSLLPTLSVGWWDVAANGHGFIVKQKWRERTKQITQPYPRVSRANFLFLKEQTNAEAKQQLRDYIEGHLEDCLADRSKRGRAQSAATRLGIGS